MPDGTDTDASKRREELTATLLLLIQRADSDLADLADSLAAGDITEEEFGDQAMALLGDAHAEAAVLGRQLGGIAGELGDADIQFGLEAALGDTGYMARFVADILGGRYLQDDGKLDRDAIKRRLRMYANGLLGTANEAWVATLDATVKITWHDTGDERECADCPMLAANGPYTPATLPCYPGDGSTECLGNCRCWLSTDTGLMGFDISGS